MLRTYASSAPLPAGTRGDRQHHSTGEPPWLPSLEVVARTRAALDSRGVAKSLLHPGEIGSVAPGEPPWLWWGAAVLWILVWPAVIAFWATGGWNRLPLLDWSWAASPAGASAGWMLLLGLTALHLMVLAWPVIRAERLASLGTLRGRFGQIRTQAQMLALTPEEFEAWIGLLFRLMGYRVRNTELVGDHGVDLVVSGERVRSGVVQCKRYRGTVGEPTVRDVYGTLVHSDADRAWLITTGAISRRAREWANGKPIELWDGKTLEATARRYRRRKG